MRSTSAVTRNCLLAVVLVCILCESSNASSQNPTNETAVMEKRYTAWLKRYRKTHDSREDWNRRFKIYQANLKFIESINAQNLPYKLTDNKFADMTNYEFGRTYLGYKSHRKTSHKKPNDTIIHSSIVSSIDWRKKGAVTPVKDQGSCGTKFTIFCYCCCLLTYSIYEMKFQE